MVQVLPGFSAQVGQNLAQIVGAVQNIMDPDYELKRMVKQKAMSDPNYAQMMANFAYTNPDAFKQLGLGKVADVIGSISPDLQTIMQEAQKGYVQDEAKKGNKELQAGVAQKALYGKTESELRMDKLRETQAGLNIALARQTEGLNEQRLKEGEMQLNQLQLQQKGILDALANYEGLKGMDLGAIADGFLNGKVDSNIASQIFSTPQLAAPMQQLLELKRQERGLMNQLRVAQYGRSLQRRSLAEEMVIRTRTGTTDLWEKYMSDKATQERLVELVADPKVAKTAEDQMLLQMYNAINEKQHGMNANTANRMTSELIKLSSQAKSPAADLNNIANIMNITLQRLGEATGNYYTAEVVEEAPLKETKGQAFKRAILGGRPPSATGKRRIIIKDIVTGEEVEPSRAVVKASGAPAGNAAPPNYEAPSKRIDPNSPNADGAKSGIDLSKDPLARDTTLSNLVAGKIEQASSPKIAKGLDALRGLDKDKQKKFIADTKRFSEVEKNELRRLLGIE